jgi:transcriptional regulator with XRE-family HTH domain
MVIAKFKDKKETLLKIAKTGNSLREFSKKIGVSQGYLSLLLTGDKNPSPTVANKIAEGLGLQVEDIFLVCVIDKSIKTGS